MKFRNVFQEDPELGRKVLKQEFIDRFIGFQTRILYTKVRQQFYHSYADLDISTVTLGLILVVAAQPGSFQKEIADRIGVPETVAVQSVKKLHERGVIKKESDPRDRRHFRLWLTKAGEELVEKVIEHSVITHERMLKGISEEEAQIFLRCSRQISKNIDDYLMSLGVEDKPQRVS